MQYTCDCDKNELVNEYDEEIASEDEKVVVQVKLNRGHIDIYKDLDLLREAMVHGRVLKTHLIRIVAEKDRGRTEELEESPWDAEKEGMRPWVFGMVMPSVAQVAVGWFYFFLLIPQMVEWMA